MADTKQTDSESPKKSSKLALIAGVVLALLGGAGGFYAVASGKILSESEEASADEPHMKDKPKKISAMPDVAFVPVDPLVISLDGEARHLRFRAQLEVAREYQEEVSQLMPRVVDVLNNYLRALDPKDLTGGGSLSQLRAQMLRRIQIVTGGDRVNDLLIMEFVLN